MHSPTTAAVADAGTKQQGRKIDSVEPSVGLSSPCDHDSCGVGDNPHAYQPHSRTLTPRNGRHTCVLEPLPRHFGTNSPALHVSPQVLDLQSSVRPGKSSAVASREGRGKLTSPLYGAVLAAPPPDHCETFTNCIATFPKRSGDGITEEESSGGSQALPPVVTSEAHADYTTTTGISSTPVSSPTEDDGCVRSTSGSGTTSAVLVSAGYSPMSGSCSESPTSGPARAGISFKDRQRSSLTGLLSSGSYGRRVLRGLQGTGPPHLSFEPSTASPVDALLATSASVNFHKFGEPLSESAGGSAAHRRVRSGTSPAKLLPLKQMPTPPQELLGVKSAKRGRRSIATQSGSSSSLAGDGQHSDGLSGRSPHTSVSPASAEHICDGDEDRQRRGGPPSLSTQSSVGGGSLRAHTDSPQDGCISRGQSTPSMRSGPLSDDGAAVRAQQDHFHSHGVISPCYVATAAAAPLAKSALTAAERPPMRPNPARLTALSSNDEVTPRGPGVSQNSSGRGRGGGFARTVPSGSESTLSRSDRHERTTTNGSALADEDTQDELACTHNGSRFRVCEEDEPGPVPMGMALPVPHSEGYSSSGGSGAAAGARPLLTRERTLPPPRAKVLDLTREEVDRSRGSKSVPPVGAVSPTAAAAGLTSIRDSVASLHTGVLGSSRRDRGKMLRRSSSSIVLGGGGGTYYQPLAGTQTTEEFPRALSQHLVTSSVLQTSGLVSVTRPPSSASDTVISTFTQHVRNLHSEEDVSKPVSFSGVMSPSHRTSPHPQHHALTPLKFAGGLIQAPLPDHDGPLSDNEQSNTRTQSQLFATSDALGSMSMMSVAATKENRRTSSFSSLQFTMQRRFRRRHDKGAATISVPATTSAEPAGGTPPSSRQATDLGSLYREEVDTVREEKGDNGSELDDAMLLEELEAEASLAYGAVGLWETVEHIFLPAYEVLEGGRTAEEVTLCSLRSGSLPGSPSPSPRHTDAVSLACGSGSAALSPSIAAPSQTVASSSPPLHKSAQKSVDATAFSFGNVSTNYNLMPEEEEAAEAVNGDGAKRDCKIAARLVINGNDGVMLVNVREEVNKYAARQCRDGAEKAGTADCDTRAGEDGGHDCGDDDNDDDAGACECDEAFIGKDSRGMDYSKYHAHTLYDHCTCCMRRPAAFFCLHCEKAVCPTHVSRHHGQHPDKCTLFLNVLDIMTSFDRVFWCERCSRFTWKYTEIYDPLVDQIAYTLGSYLQKPVRDIHCIGIEANLHALTGDMGSKTYMGGPADEDMGSVGIITMPSPVMSPANMSPVTGNIPTLEGVAALSPEWMASGPTPAAGGGLKQSSPLLSFSVKSPMHCMLARDSVSLQEESGFVTVGEAVTKLVAVGASVQGWRSTQEDAEAAFLVELPELRLDASLPIAGAKRQLYADSKQGGSMEGSPSREAEEPHPQSTIPMAVFCVFDGHGGDAVAKLAASRIEQHLRQAIEHARPDDIRARALLFHLNNESSPRQAAILHTFNTAATHSLPASFQSYARNSIGASPGPTLMRSSDQRQSPPQPARLLVPGSEAVSTTGDVEADAGAAAAVTSITEATLQQHISAAAYDASSSPKHPDQLSHQQQHLLRAWNYSSEDMAQVDEPHREQLAEARKGSGLAGLALSPSAVMSVSEVEMLRSYFASIMEDAILSLDDYLRKTPEGERGDYNCVGCTACVVGVTSNFILCANVGDSGAAFYTPKTIERISVTHRITAAKEQDRIKAAGYSVINDRVEGLLAVPRALGDFDFKQSGARGPREQAVIAVPDVTIRPVPSDEDRWGIIVACDGVWDTATQHQVHFAITNTPYDLDVAGSASDATLRARELLQRNCLDPLCLPEYQSKHDGAGAVGGQGDLVPVSAPRPDEVLPEGDRLPAGARCTVDPHLLTAAAGVFAQCVAPADNEEGIGLDNCSLIIIEKRL